MASPSFTARQSAIRLPLAVTDTRLAVVAIGTVVTATWLLQHLYLGIWHDSILYSMQGLAHLHPHLYDHDIFLRYGSQDEYSLFGPLYAPLIGWLGVDHAAEWVTLLSECAFFWVAWKLARRLMAPPWAMLAIGLLVALPGYYGTAHIFTVIEDFATPRLAAEALVIGALLVSMSGRMVVAGLLCAAAAALHPIMAAAGIALLVWRHIGSRRPALAATAVCAALVGLTVLALLPAAGFLRFDNLWLRLVSLQAPYLLLSGWSLNAWEIVTLTMGTLTVGAIVLDSDRSARTLAIEALATGLTGLALTAFGGDLLHFILIVRAQPWRWLWLSQAVAILLLPLIGQRLWRRGPLARSALLLLCAGYLEQATYGPAAFWLSALAVLAACAATLRSRILMHWGRFGLYAAAGILIVYATWYVAVAALSVFGPRWYDIGSAALDPIRHLFHDGILPALALIALTSATLYWPRRRLLALLAASGAAASIALMPVAVQQWTQVIFPQSLVRAFASWRAQIPKGTEVLFATDQPIDPLACWVLLQRPSYLSGLQTLSGLFSRRTALVTYRRSVELAPLFGHIGPSLLLPNPAPTSQAIKTLTLRDVCGSAHLRFIATRTPLHAVPIATIPRSVAGRFWGLKLYRCPP